MFLIHNTLSAWTKIEELSMTDEEAQKLGKATRRVAELYEVDLLPSQKAVAWLNLLKVAGSVYGPRIGAYKMNRPKKQRPGTIQGVTPINGTF